MKLIKPEDLTPKNLAALSNPQELSAEESAEVMRLFAADLSVEKLDDPSAWSPAEPVDELLAELDELEKKWDEQHS